MRLFLVSNRVSLPQRELVSAGGLEVALRGVLGRYDCVWVGWSGQAVESEAQVEITTSEAAGTEYVVTDLLQRELDEYYNGFANRVLWPVLHYRQDLAEFSRADLSGYVRANERFADLLAARLQPDDVVWVHDYHLMPLARIMRERGFTNLIGFFLHIPMPAPEVIAAMPGHRRVIGALADYDLVGFQTDTDTANFARYLAKLSGKTPHFGMTSSGASMRIGTFPVGIETKSFHDEAGRAANSELTTQLKLRSPCLAIGVDRLDYSKGLDLKFDAYGRFLHANPQWRGKVTLLQIAPRSRSAIPEYAAMETALATSAGRINSEHGDVLWTPIHYISRAYPREVLAGLFRVAKVGVVTPLRDGMNLVAKEYVASQDMADPGILVLSEFAGAAAELDAALLVNPNDPEAVAAAIHSALSMPLNERRDRQQTLWNALLKTDIAGWGESFVRTLTEGPSSGEDRVRPAA